MGMKNIFILSIAVTLSAFMLCPPAMAQDSATYFHIDINTHGSASWRVEYTMVLCTDSEIESWNSTNVNESDDNLHQYEEDISAIVTRASQTAGRHMTALDVELDFHLSPISAGSSDDCYLGVIEYTFTWGGFAIAGSGTITVGDAFVDGFYLEKENAMYISPPAGYRIMNATPEPDVFAGETAVWFGDVDTNAVLGMRVFDPGFPRLNIEQESVSVVGGETDEPNGGIDAIILFALIAGVTGIVVIAWWYVLGIRKQRTDSMESDREKLISFIQKAGGQVYQSDLIDATGYSEAKVSLMVSELHKENLIVKVRKGNRNIIRLL